MEWADIFRLPGILEFYMDNDKMNRPLDVLGSSQDKRVIIRMKSGETINGILKAFDQHINIWMDDAEI